MRSEARVWRNATKSRRANQSFALTILGLGPGDEEHITVEAQRALRRATEIWVRSQAESPPFLDSTGKVRDFGEIEGPAADTDEAARSIVSKVIELARRPQGVIYAVRGHPLVGDPLTPRLIAAAKAESLPARVIAGVSDVDCALSSLRVESNALQVLAASSLADRGTRAGGAEVPWPRLLSPSTFIATVPLMICRLRRELVTGVQEALLESYPPAHEVSLLAAPAEEHRVVRLDALADQPDLTDRAALYVPPLGILDDLYAFSTFRHIVARLRAPGGCPWDREQTHESLKPYLVEECYEVLEALDEADLGKLEEELGDLLLQIVLHSQLAAEAGNFSIKDVLAHISAKLIRRHPHVFGDRVVADSSEVVRNWEAIKRAEKGAKVVASLLGGVPKDMPALAHAASIQRRVADVGFDWRDTADALAKVVEELGELEQASGSEERLLEFGDLLFAIVSAGRRLDLDAEEALRLANARFMRRFSRLEELARGRGLVVKDLPAERLAQLWREAKPAD